MAQLTIQNNGRQPFTFFVLRTGSNSSDATILEKINLRQGDQVHCKIGETIGNSFSIGVGSGGEKGDTASKASVASSANIDFAKHDRWTAIYNGEQWSIF